MASPLLATAWPSCCIAAAGRAIRAAALASNNRERIWGTSLLRDLSPCGDRGDGPLFAKGCAAMQVSMLSVAIAAATLFGVAEVANWRRTNRRDVDNEIGRASCRERRC